MTPGAERAVDAVLARRRSHGSSDTYVPDVASKAFNRGLIAAIVALDLASEVDAQARLRELQDADDDRRDARLDKLNAELRDA